MKKLRLALFRFGLGRNLLVLFILALISITLAGRYQIRQSRQDALAGLQVLAQLKAEEIRRWLEEKRASIIQPDSGYLASALMQWQSARPEPNRDELFRQKLAFYLARYPEASRVVVLDAAGAFIISSDSAQTEQALPADFSLEMPASPAQLVNFHADERGQPRLGFLTPLIYAGQRQGFVLIEFDPQRELYPSLNQWPGLSDSGEILLYRRIHQEIEYLSPLRKEALLPLSRHRSSASEPQITAQQRQSGFGDRGFDTQGRPVLRAIYPVKGTDWVVAARIALLEADRRAWVDILLFSLFLALLLGSLALILHLSNRRAAAVASEAQRQHDKRLLLDFIDAVPESLFMLDRQGQVLVMNVTGAERLGLTPQQIIGRKVWDLLPPGLQEKRQHIAESVFRERKPKMITDSRDQRHFLTYIYPSQNGETCVYVGMDVTERKQIETALRERDELLRNLSEHLPESFLYQVCVYPDGRRQFLYVSAGIEQIHGISPEQAMTDASCVYALVDPLRQDELARAEARCLQTLSDLNTTVRMRRVDGSWGWFTLHSHPHLGENGAVIWDGLASDITAIRENELKLASQARRTSALLTLPSEAESREENDFLQYTLDIAEGLTESRISFLHFVHEDQNQIELMCWSRKTLAHYCHAVFSRHYAVEKAGIWGDAIRLRQPVVVNDYAAAQGKQGLPPGHAQLQRMVCVPVIEDGRVRLVAGVGNKDDDYTEDDVETLQLIANDAWRIAHRRRAERDLRQIAQVVEASPTICFRWESTEGWPVQFVSDNVRRWGYEPQQLISGEIPYVSLLHPDDVPRIVEEVQTFFRQKQKEYTQEYRLRCADGRYIWVLDLTTVHRDARDQVDFIEGVLSDISERKQQQLVLEESLAQQRALNRQLEDAQTQLLQSEKLAAIGQLAAGVAHELNNPIGFVYSNLGTLTEYVTGLIAICDAYGHLSEKQPSDCPGLAEIQRIKQDQDYEYLRGDIFPLLDESREGLIRVRKIVQDLRDFSRSGNQDWAAADLHKGIDSTLNIVANELKYKCTVVKEYADLPEVVCVISQLNQVFLNLLVNAAQAIEKQGTITISTGVADADHVWISIADTGQGIAPENLKRIFDPFFTTKPVGMGTGLGLALVFGIINRHHGQIEVVSELGKGTTFRMTLPVRQADPAESGTD